MAPPLYFFPDVHQADLVQSGRLAEPVLRERGLAQTFADLGAVQTDAYVEEPPGAGPGGKAGTFLMALPVSGRKPALIGYQQDRHDWTEFHHAGSTYSVGIDKLDPPTPDDLARKEQVRGYSVEIDGRAWQVPVIRNPEGGTGLRCDWLLEEDGTCNPQIQAKYRQLWEDLAAVVDVFYDPDDLSGLHVFRMAAADALRWAIAVLAINYRFGRAEQNTIRVINSDNWAELLAHAVDVPTFYAVYLAAQEAKKKRALDESPDPETRDESPDTAPGPPAGSPATDPAAPS